jgi:hypothetical protein
MTTWVNSQFPRPDFHRQVQRHYGLRSRVEVWRGGAVVSTGLRFHTPLIKLDERFSRIQLSLQGVSHQ